MIPSRATLDHVVGMCRHRSVSGPGRNPSRDRVWRGEHAIVCSYSLRIDVSYNPRRDITDHMGLCRAWYRQREFPNVPTGGPGRDSNHSLRLTLGNKGIEMARCWKMPTLYSTRWSVSIVSETGLSPLAFPYWMVEATCSLCFGVCSVIFR